MKEEDKESICLSCLYGSQPYCYYPIVCVHGKRSKDMYHDVHKCKHFEPSPEINGENCLGAECIVRQYPVCDKNTPCCMCDNGDCSSRQPCPAKEGGEGETDTVLIQLPMSK